MTVASVHQFKAQLSYYLGLVQVGKRLIITNHNKPIAEIIQPKSCLEAGADVERILLTGRAQWNGKKPHGAHVKLKSKGKLASKMVLEDRR